MPSLSRPVSLLALLALLLVPSCGTSHERFSQAWLEVVVVDRDGYAWEGVEVRIVEAWNEWSACVCKGREPWSVDFTDRDGQVIFGPKALAYAELGFQEEPGGVAVLGSRSHDDEAVLKLLVGHDKLGWVKFDVPLTYYESSATVTITL